MYTVKERREKEKKEIMF